MTKFKSIRMRWITVVSSLMFAIGLLSVPQTKLSANTGFTSVYTDIKQDCRTLPLPKGAATVSDPEKVCKAVGGYRIAIGYSAWGASIAAESLKNRSDAIVLEEEYGGYGAKGEKIEWRMADNQLFAVIVRIGKYKETSDGGNPFADEKRTGSKLVIKGLKGWEHIDFEIDGATLNANEKARQMADQNYLKNK